MQSNKWAQIFSMLVVLALTFSALGTTPARAAGIRYVTPTGSGNCSSWTNACGLQTALTGAVSGDEIWVAAGTYTPTSGIDRNATFQLKSGVAIYGGFTGAETTRDQRNPATNATVLSGDLLGNDNNYVMPNEPTRAENSYHVVTGANGATLDGFTVTAGQANASVSPNNRGGGIYNSGSSPTLANLILSVNLATDSGGGMHNVSGSNPSLSNVTFDGNTCSEDGGGMSNYSSSPILINVTFSENGGYQGGGMSNAYGSHPTLTNVIFNNNDAYDGSGMFNYDSSSSYSVLTNVTFSSNTGVNGAMFNYYNSPTLTNVTFTSNAHTVGGGIYNVNGSNPQLTNVTFINNSANMGGGIYNASGSNPILTNVTFRDNTAVYEGGGISNHSMGNPQIHNTIFWDNTAPEGAQIYNQSTVPPASSTVNDSILQGGCPTGSNCTNPIISDPKLGTFGNYGGFTQTVPLLTGSSAIDAGNDSDCPATDQRDMPRPQGTHCDIGAFEREANVAVTIGNTSTQTYNLFSNQSTRASYAVNNGPVKVFSPTGTSLIASERVAYKNGTAWTSFSEMMGLPANQATTSYWFPWYNNVDLNTQLRFANLGNTPANVWITIGGVAQAPIPLAVGESTRISYPINNGPVKVESSMGNIIASMRVAYKDGTAWTNFSEVLGIPANQATTAYYFPWYNNLDLNTQIRFANVSNAPTTVWITIGNAVQAPITLAAGESTRVSYPISNGPVKVESSMGNIIASMRVAYKDGTVWKDFSEVMGLPADQATTTYWFPWYNNVDLNTQIRFANLSNAPTTVTVTIGGIAQTPIPLATGESTRVSYAINNGPVKVQSSGGNIVASIRVAYNDGTAWTSFSEVFGMPANQLTTTYYFPWYNNLDLNTQVRFAVP